MNFVLEKTEVSTEILDNDHLGFVYLVNKLLENQSGVNSDKIILSILDEFETYAIAHFQTEEKYFKIHNYTNIELKTVKNDIMLEKIYEYRSLYLNKKIDFQELLNFLCKWLITHFKDHDIKFEVYAKETCLNSIVFSKSNII